VTEERRVVLHVQEDVTPAAVKPVPRDLFATIVKKFMVSDACQSFCKAGSLPVNSSEFSIFPLLFIISVTPIIPKAKRAPRPITTP
jgi:hypothetical protein